jgi:hypothetical protein
MPYMKKQVDGKWQVYKKGDNGEPTGDALGTHDSEKQADEQIAAIYANEDAKKVAEATGFVKFVQLEKVDAKTGQVWGVLSNETPDKSGEIIDYEHSKKHFVQWSETMKKDSGGKSAGNLRAMHGGELAAAGRIIHFEARDATKDFYIGAEVVDKGDLEKVEKGVYTGFSVGGGYGPWFRRDGQYLRREGKPVEASLVDSPCNPDATFTLVKADGSTEMRKFVVPTQPAAPVDAAPAASPKSFDEFVASLPEADQAVMKKYAAELKKAIPAEDPKAADKSSDNGGAAAEPAPAEGSQAAKAPNLDDLRAVILSIIEELGLVVKEGEAIKAVQPLEMQKAAQALDLVKADVVAVRADLVKVIEDGDKALAGDIGKLIASDEDILKRMEKVTGMGPVIMITDAAGDTKAIVQRDIEVLKKYQESAKTPADREKFGQLIAEAEIRAIQNPTKGG